MAEDPTPDTDAVEMDAPLEAGEAHDPKDQKGGLINRMNPMRLFRKNSVAFQLSDAQSLLEKKLFAQATIAFQKTLELEPDNVEAIKGLGRVLMMKGGRMNLEASLKQFDQGALRDPLDEELYALKSQVLQVLGRAKESTLEKKKALSLRTLRREPQNAVAANNVGITLMRIGKTDTAITYFQKSIDNDRNYDMPRRNLASTYFQLAEREQNPPKQKELLSKALAEATKALEIGESAASFVVMARILVKSGDTEHALEIINKADEMQPSSKMILTIKQGVLEKLNRQTEARETYEGAKNLATA